MGTGVPRAATGSLGFDPVARAYDRTRLLPPAAERDVVELLMPEIRRAGGRCLEIGVGTGRVALPLHGAGASITGLDLSPLMLARIIEKSGGRSPFPLVLADATRLPFPAAVFGSALAAHVLHLIADWRTVVDEVARVVRPGGVALMNPPGHWARTDPLMIKFTEQTGTPLFIGMGWDQVDDLDDAFAARGAGPRELPTVSWVERRSPAEVIRSMADGLYSFTWLVGERERRRAADAVREWALTDEAGYGGDLDTQIHVEHQMRWRAYELP